MKQNEIKVPPYFNTKNKLNVPYNRPAHNIQQIRWGITGEIPQPSLVNNKTKSISSMYPQSHLQDLNNSSAL